METTKPTSPYASLLRGLPAVHRLLAAPTLKETAILLPASLITQTAQEVLDEVRSSILHTLENSPHPFPLKAN